VTSQGSLHGQFQRAAERGNVLQAVAIARDLGELSLSSSFALLLLFAEHDPERFNRPPPRASCFQPARYRLRMLSRSWPRSGC
jgi:hypothetical protein